MEKCEKESAALQNERILLSSKLKQTSDERDDSVHRLADLQQVNDLLNMDKTYLNKELESLRDRTQLAEEKLTRKNRKLHELKQSRDDLFHQLLQSKDLQKTSFEQRLQEEVEHLRKQTTSDLEQMRSNAKELFEHERR